MGKDIYIKYQQTDTSTYRESVLILYTDKTYVNFGILNVLESPENYVSFDYGNWISANSEVVCNSNPKVFSQEKVVNEIKMYYKGTLMYSPFDDYYKYAKEPHKNYSFILIKNKAIDLTKKIEYKNFQSNELKLNN
ncbi:MAG: hypothetical protein V4677_01630 [Bacteroidota bacterium]